MTTFTIDAENSITAFPTPDLAEAAVGTGAQPFNSQQQLAELAATWPAERLLAIWNSFAGVAGFGADLKPVQKFTDRKTAIKRIWTAIQKLAEAEARVPQTSEALAETAAPQGSAARPAAEQEKPKAAKKAKGGAPAAKGAPVKGKTTKNATSAKNAPKAKKAAKAAADKKQTAAPREGTKTAQVVAMLQRKNGATLEEIMSKMGWLKHTVRGFMAGAMKKAGYTVESFKSDRGERTYRIN
jgi:hypothetical protein